MRRAKRIPRALLIFLGSGFISFIYLPTLSFGQKVTSENGIPVVANPKASVAAKGAPTQLRLRQDLLIGRESGVEDYMFSELRSVQVDDQENIYVLDWKENKIKVFDKVGKHLRTFGKKGQGPGEIQAPSGMDLTPGGRLAIFDRGNKRIACYSLTGECLKEISTAKWSFIRVSLDSRSFIYGDNFVFRRDALTLKLLKFDPELNPVSTVQEVTAELKPPRVNPMPGRFIYDVMRNDNLVWGLTTKYELQIASPEGKPVRKIVKDCDPVKITDKDKEELIKNNYGDKGAPQDIILEWPAYHPPMVYMLVDDQNRIFVRTSSKDAEGNYHCDVFGPDGTCSTAFNLPENEIPMAVKKDKMYCLIRENEAGIPQVKRYAMEWK
jgi:hypothetical protein